MHTGTGKTVYLLGAGASAASDFSLPVMKGFLKDEEPTLANATEFLKILYPTLNISELNVEDVLTHLDLAVDGFGSRWGNYAYSGPDLERRAQTDIHGYIHERLAVPDDKVCKQHLAIVKSMSPKDSIVSLNYDLVCDNAIWSVAENKAKDSASKGLLERSHDILSEMPSWGGIWPTLRPGTEGLGYYLKLHGSLNWIYCSSPICPNHNRFFPISNSNRAKGRSLRGPCAMCGNPLETVIIPPVIGKSIRQFPKMGFIWNLAYRELIEADRIIVIGCSLPPSDYVLRWLLRTSQVNRKRARLNNARVDYVPLELNIVNRDSAVYPLTKEVFLSEKAILFNDMDSYIKTLE